MAKAVRIVALLLVFSSCLMAQENPLFRRINLQLEHVSTAAALKAIAQKGNFLLSYNASGIDENKVVSLVIHQQTVKQALEQTLGNAYTYRAGGTHVIIIPKKHQATAHQKVKYELSGQIRDAQSGALISSASITEVGHFTSTLSDKQGKYILPIHKDVDYARVLVSRKNYRDTVLTLRPEEIKMLDVRLKPLPEVPILTPLSANIPVEMSDNGLFQAVVTEEQLSQTENRPLYEQRMFQLSFLPVLGSNRSFSGLIENHFSLNILGGYSMALSGVEVGGVFNITRNYVKGAQFGGLMNITGGKTEGVQFAGFMNNNIGSIRGVQMAGFYNLSLDSLEGLQAAGFFNMARKSVRGIQTAGFLNVSGKELKGIQAAGFMNLSGKKAEGLQVAGFSNVAAGNFSGIQATAGVNVCAGNLRGIQYASLINVAFDSSRAVQISTLGNYAKRIKGLQLSAILNIAGKIKGTQIGLVNVCDSIQGASIGLLSLVRRGVHQLELSTGDVNHVLVNFRTGTPHFYNIISAGMFRPDNANYTTFGYGIGTEFRYTKKFFFGLDAVASIVFNESLKANITPDLWLRSNLYLGYRPAKHFCLFAGPTWNFYRIDASNALNDRPAIGRDELYSYQNAKAQFSGWLGWQAGVRIF